MKKRYIYMQSSTYTGKSKQYNVRVPLEWVPILKKQENQAKFIRNAIGNVLNLNQPRDPNPMKQYEYKFVSSLSEKNGQQTDMIWNTGSNTLEKALNDLGNKGWIFIREKGSYQRKR